MAFVLYILQFVKNVSCTILVVYKYIYVIRKNNYGEVGRQLKFWQEVFSITSKIYSRSGTLLRKYEVFCLRINKKC
jgi:hypothetical protein